MEETKCNFKLNVSSIREFSSTAVHTNLTLTDEIAIAYLRVNINRLSQFSKYPSNLDELLVGKKIKQEVKKSVKKEYKKTTKKNK